MESQLNIIENHVKNCEATYQVLLEENSFLRQTRSNPPAEILDKKAAILAELQISTAALKSIEKSSPALRLSIENAQKKTMKILHLVRENEQMLLNNPTTLVSHAVTTPSSAQVNKVYIKY